MRAASKTERPDRMPKGDARELLRRDARRRGLKRAGGLIVSGFLGSLALWEIALLWAVIAADITGTTPDLLRIGDPFAASVDPVLPTLVSALLALAVVKATGLGSEIIVWVSSLIGAMGVSWAFLSASALIGADRPPHAVSNTVASAALAAVCVAVAVAITEVLPLSASLRRTQQHSRLAHTRKATALLISRANEKGILHPRPAWHRPRASTWTLTFWYVTPPVVILLSFVPYAATADPDERAASFVVAGAFAALVIAIVWTTHTAIVGHLQSTDTLRRSAFGTAMGLVLLLEAALVALSIAMLVLVWPIPVLVVAPVVVSVVVLAAALLPLAPWFRTERPWGLLTHAAVTRRSFTLQRRAARIHDLVAAERRLRR